MDKLRRVIHSSDIKHYLINEIEHLNTSFTVVSAYCKRSAFEVIERKLSLGIEKKILVRFRLEDLISGASDLEVFEFARDHGWDVYCNQDLHSKIYVFDDKRVMLGSANLTDKGLGLGQLQNIESVIINEINPYELASINRIFEFSVQLDNEIISQMREELQFHKLTTSSVKMSWSQTLLRTLSKVNGLWTSELLFSFSPFMMDQHDIELLNLREQLSREQVLKQFCQTRVFFWLKQCLMKKNVYYFGELTIELEMVLIDDPKPYRRDIKELLSNLLNWVQVLEIEGYIVDRPRHSQRITYTR